MASYLLFQTLMSMKQILASVLIIYSSIGVARPLPMASGNISVPLPLEREQIREQILSDFGQRISPDFKVPEELRQRVAFWFDIYSLYGSNHYVIHHIRYPWVIYEVIDVTSMIQNGKGPEWLRRERAQKFVKARTQQIRTTLNNLARGKKNKKSADLEKSIMAALEKAPGNNRKQKLRLAAQSVRNQLGQRDFFKKGLEYSTHYIPFMEKEFERLGLPTELTRMPFVESSFNTEARSKVGASGIWQIMPATGKAYMIVRDDIDERNNPIKATTAAGKLIRGYFKALKTWPLTITSYNHGIGNIQKAIRKAGSRELPTIINRYHAGDFKFASSNFFTCFLAALYSEKYSELLFYDVQKFPPKSFEITMLPKPIKTLTLIKNTGISKEEFIRYNLDLKHAAQKNVRLPKGLKVLLPTGMNKALAANEM